MKLSLAWICDYINVNYTEIDITTLVERFNKTVAEIEAYYQVVCDVDSLSVCRIVTSTHTHSRVFSQEWECEIELPLRSHSTLEQWYLVKREGDKYRWALSTDLGAKKSMIVPELWASDAIRDGSWKKHFEVQDWILELDNKSITNRPDLWGHYGIAREIAVLFNYELIPFSTLLAQKDIHHGQERVSTQDGFSITNEAPKGCSRFAGLYFEYIEHRASFLWMTSRLSRVDSRAIDAIVDITNYVMLDMSQPLHAFDAHTLADKSIQVRMADNKETLQLLDDSILELTASDMVISDGDHPIALAGIMGGKKTGVTNATTTIFLEAACFDATIIRKTSAQFSLRTDASARFEKSLDPNQNILGILRFLYLIYAAEIAVKESDAILSLGKSVAEKQIQILHEFIEQRLGTSVSSEFVLVTLRNLGFTVDTDGHLYTILIPTFRGNKTSALKEDIVEEVGRFFGYENIPYVFPKRQMRPFSLKAVMRTRAIKQLLAFGVHMHEIQSYAFFDQSFIDKIGWEASNALAVQNPVSGNWKHLVTSLLPNLFKVVSEHAADNEQLRFFEWGRIWTQKNQMNESKSLSGIVYEQKNPLTFYMGKALLSELFTLLQMDVTWLKSNPLNQPWFVPSKTAILLHKGTRIGQVGMVEKCFLESIALGNAFAFELDGDYLLSWDPPLSKYVPASKFPIVYRDISLFVPCSVTVDEIRARILKVDSRINDVKLEDYFEKKEWGTNKSVTMRFAVVDQTKTLTKEEVDLIIAAVEEQLQQIGATVR